MCVYVCVHYGFNNAAYSLASLILNQIPFELEIKQKKSAIQALFTFIINVHFSVSSIYLFFFFFLLYKNTENQFDIRLPEFYS